MSHIRAAAIVTVLSVLGTGVSVAQERITICQTQEGQYSAAVAFGADSFLVVWQDGRPGGGVRSIYYTWVDREGGVLPVNGYPLCQGTDPRLPAVAFDPDEDGTPPRPRFLVVWQDWAPPPDWDIDIWGALVYADGGSSPPPFRIADVGWQETSPDVAFNGSKFFVVWRDSTEDLDAIRGRWVRPNGELGDYVTVSDESEPEYDPAVASDGNDFFVAWAYRVGYTGLEGAIVSEGGIDRFTIQEPEWADFNPSVCFDDPDYLVVWCKRQGGLFKPFRIFGRFYDVEGTPTSDSFAVCLDSAWTLNPNVASGDLNCLAVWERTCAKVRHIHPAGMPVGQEHECFEDPVAPYDKSPDVASCGDKFLVVCEAEPPYNGIFGTFESPFQRRFFSQRYPATAPNQGRNITIDPETGWLHMVFWSGSLGSSDSMYYSCSTNGGSDWFPCEYAGPGKFPCVASENLGSDPVWVCYQLDDYSIACKARQGPNDWVGPFVLFEGNEEAIPSPPSMSVCYEQSGPVREPQVYVVIAVWRGDYESSVRFYKVNLYQGVVEDTVIVGPITSGLTAPSVATTPGDIVHVTWENAHTQWVYYKQRYYGDWKDSIPISEWEELQQYIEPARSPCVDVYGDSVYIVWQGNDYAVSGDGDVWLRKAIIQEVPNFLEPKDKSNTQYSPSEYPQNSTRFYATWAEGEYETPDIWGCAGQNVVTVHSSELASVYPNVLALPPEPGQSDHVLTHSVWTEQVSDLDYEVAVKCTAFGLGAFGADYCYYGCAVGDSLQSRYCTARDGVARWRGISVDYGREHLRYRLPFLNPYRIYLMRAVLYHATPGVWDQGFSVDGLPMGRYRHEALVPETVWVTIPRGTYERDCQVELDVTRYSGDYAVLADLRIYECYPFRQKRGGGIQSHAALPLETGAALGEFIPTPFRNQVCINYSLLTKGSLSLKIYDVQGRYVRTLASGSHRSGQYVVRWDGTDRRGMLVPAGTYFCRLEADGTQDIRKLVLAR